MKRVERLAQQSIRVSKRKSVYISFEPLEKFFEINFPSKALHCSLSLSSPIIYLASRNKKINQTRTQTCRSENLERYTSTIKMSIIPTGRHDYNYGHFGVTRRNQGGMVQFEHDKPPPYSRYCTYDSNHGLFWSYYRNRDTSLTQFHCISILAACSPLSSPRGVNGILYIPQRSCYRDPSPMNFKDNLSFEGSETAISFL